MPLVRKNLFVLLMLGLAAGCSSLPEQKKDNSAPAESPTNEQPPADQEQQTTSDDTGTDEPAWVNAMYLTLSCKPKDQNQDTGMYTVTCQLLTKEGKALFPEAFAESYQWGIEGLEVETNKIMTESSGGTEYFATLKVGNEAFITPEALASLKVTFNYVDKSTNKATVLDSRLNTIFKGLENQKYFRLVISSIRDHDPGSALQQIDKMEVKINGAWLELTVNQTSKNIEVNGTPCVSNGTEADLLLFLNITAEIPYMRASDFVRFNTGAPAFNATEPLTLAFGGGKAFSLTGFRYNSGQPLTNTNVPAGFPDVFRFETSPDQQTWTTVPGSSINIDSISDADVLQYVWTGSEKS
jgi:hypothetical protein